MSEPIDLVEADTSGADFLLDDLIGDVRVRASDGDVFIGIGLFTGRYPPTLFNFALGLDRWSFRVAAYVGLMTDTYPHVRLDMGPSEPTTAEQTTLEATEDA